MTSDNKSVVLYERFSPRSANGDSKCESILTQSERLHDYCRALGLTIVGEYADEELSGKTMEGREGLEKALAKVYMIHGTLMVYSLSRLARNTRDAILIAEQLEEHGCELSSLHERIDTSTPIGRFFFTVMASLAQLEREQTVERTKEAMHNHQARGRRMGRADKLPFGYDNDPNDPKRLVPNAAEQSIIEFIKGLHDQGLGFRAICRELDAAGILRRGKTWDECHGLVRDILRREARKQESLPA